MKKSNSKSKSRTYNGYTFRDDTKSYRTYIKMYEKKKKYLAAKYNYEMPVKRMTKTQWRETYVALVNQQRAEVKAGIRKTTGAVNQEIVSIQAYDVTLKQAERIKKYALPRTAQKLSIGAIRTGNFDWNIVSEQYKALRSGPDGLSAKDAKNLTSWYFFGSK